MDAVRTLLRCYCFKKKIRRLSEIMPFFKSAINARFFSFPVLVYYLPLLIVCKKIRINIQETVDKLSDVSKSKTHSENPTFTSSSIHFYITVFIYIYII